MAIKKFPLLSKKEPKVTINQKTKPTPLGFSVTSQFFGYRSKEDITNLPAGYLVPPSQNVVSNTQGLIQTRLGYTLDGQIGASGNPILGSFDWNRGINGQRVVRSGNNKVQYRYVANAGDKYNGITFTATQVYWIDLITGSTNDRWNFTTFFDFTSEKINVMLGVNRNSAITEWSGAVGTITSATAASILLKAQAEAKVVVISPSIISGTNVSTLTGSTTTVGNVVLSGTDGNGKLCLFFIFNNKPNDGDTSSVVINGVSFDVSFWSGIVGAGGAAVPTGVSAANSANNYAIALNSPNNAGIFANDQCFTIAQGTQLAWIVANSLTQPSISGNTTATGNIANGSGASTITLNSNPTNGEVIALNLNGQVVNIQFVSLVGLVPGNVLIGVNLAATLTNLLGLLQNPSTTNATQVALSTNNQFVVGAFAASQTNTITLNGSLTWAELGFYVAKSPRSVVINGNVYSYTGGETSQVLSGVTPDPSAEPANSVVHQLPIVTQNSSTTDLPADFRNDIIGNFNNQILVASIASNIFYLSMINNYTNYSQSSPRLPGDGFTGSVDGLVNGVIPQESTLYVAWGISGWTTFDFTLSADLVNETVVITPLKVAPLQSALSQGLMTNIGNDIAFITDEPTLSTLGRVAAALDTPQITNMSDPIKNDMDMYTSTGFADGQILYTKYFIWVSLPKLGIVRKYNISQGWWEAPLILPTGRFSQINGIIYGHSSTTDETFLLDNGTNDNGNPMHAIAAFSYDNFEDRVAKKRFEEWYLEGYISSNTTIDALTKFDFGGFSGINTYQVLGTGKYLGASITTIFQTIADGSLGRNPLGLEPIGSVTDSPSNLPKFRIIFTGIPTAFYEYQPYFESNDIDQQWQLLAYGPRIQKSNEPTDIRY